MESDQNFRRFPLSRVLDEPSGDCLLKRIKREQLKHRVSADDKVAPAALVWQLKRNLIANQGLS